MESKFAKTKLIISVLIVFIVSVFGCVCNVEAKVLDVGYMPGNTNRLKLISVENETESLEFQTFYGGDSASSFIFPQSTFHFAPQKALELVSRDMLVIKCCKGSYVPVFIQDGSLASGIIEPGYEGPFYISMWLQFPQAPESSKVHVRYLLKKGKIGTIGVKIGKKGDYRLVAHDDVKFIS